MNELFNFTSILESSLTWSSPENESNFNIYKEEHPKLIDQGTSLLIWSLVDQLGFDIHEVFSIIEGHRVGNIQMFLFCYRSIQLGKRVHLSFEKRSATDPTKDEKLVRMIQQMVHEMHCEAANVYDVIAFLDCTEVDDAVSFVAFVCVFSLYFWLFQLLF